MQQKTPQVFSGSVLALSLSGLATWLFLRRTRPRASSYNNASARSAKAGSDAASEQKMVLVVRKDLGMKQGKIAAQCAHAAVGIYAKLNRTQSDRLRAWELQGQPKVCVKADSLDELSQLDASARSLRLPTFVVQDAGRTQIDPGSSTVLAVGPGPKHKVDQVTGAQKLL